MESLLMLRFAPSPTGDMDIAHLRIAILNYLVAQQKKEQFILRIEDTNGEKNIEGKDTEIIQILEKFALNHSSSFHQSEHIHMYQTLAIKLLEENKAFVCTCTDETLNANKAEAKAQNITYAYSGQCEHKNKAEYAILKASKEPFVLRIKKPKETIINHDLIKGKVSTEPNEVDAFVILTSQGLATYNFACACDDMLSAITIVIREDKHLSNTPKQMHIKNQLGYKLETTYAHVPMIIDDENFSVQWLFEEGFIPDAIINYLLLLGNTSFFKKVFTLPQSLEDFDLKKLSSSPSKFDIHTLRFINTEHLKLMDDKKLSSLFGFADEKIGQLAKVYLQEHATTKELQNKILPIFAPKDFSGDWGKEMRIIERLIQDAPMFYDFDDFRAYIIDASAIEDEAFSQAFRLLLTGANHGPKLREIYPLINAYLLEVAS